MAILLALSFLIYFRWLTPSIFSSSDLAFKFAGSLRDASAFGAWNTTGFGDSNAMLWRLMGPDNVVYGLFGSLGFDSNVADWILVIFPWIVLSVVASFLLVKEMTNSRVGGFFGAIVFACSTYFLASIRAGHLFLPIAFAFATVTFFVYFRFLKKRTLLLGSLSAIFLFITGAYDFRSVYITVWLLFFFSIFHIFFVDEKSNVKKKFKRVFISLSPILIFFLLNLFWLLPAFLGSQFSGSSILNRSLFGSSFFDLSRAITLFHPFWVNGNIEWFFVQNIPLYFWVIPLLAFVSLFLHRNSKEVWFFAFIALFGIFLSKQSAEPFVFIYGWLFENFPGFNAFREASKFYFLITLGYSVLIGFLADWIWRNLSANKWRRVFRGSLLIVLSFLFIWNTRPIFSGEIGPIFTPRNIPEDYFSLKDLILAEGGNFRTLWVPELSRWSYYDDSHPKIGLSEVLNEEWKSARSLVDARGFSHSQEHVSVLLSDHFKKLLDLSSVKYVVLPIRDFENADDPFESYTGIDTKDIRELYEKSLDSLGYLKRIDSGFDSLILYENFDYRPRLYVSNQEDAVSESISWQPVPFVPENPSKYFVQIDHVNDPFWLNFTEKYHPDWEVRVGKFRWWNGIVRDGYFLPQ